MLGMLGTRGLQQQVRDLEGRMDQLAGLWLPVLSPRQGLSVTAYASVLENLQNYST